MPVTPQTRMSVPPRRPASDNHHSVDARLSTELSEGIDRAISRGVAWLIEHTGRGRSFEPAPIGFYFAKLWYWEQLYPLIWTVGALEQVAVARQDHSTETRENTDITFCATATSAEPG